MQKHCKCKLCKKEFIIDENIAEGGFGSVYIVHKPVSKLRLFKSEINQTTPQKYILKKLEMKDITDLDGV